jgi:hypothetical protein
MRLFCLALAVAGLLACGPVDYLHTVALKATSALARARAAGAERLAPYEYWSSVEYLQMARDTASYADYQLSSRYGEKAETMAKKAHSIAIKKREAGPAAEAEPATGARPAVTAEGAGTPASEEKP